jgi:hypothetical protein
MLTQNKRRVIIRLAAVDQILDPLTIVGDVNHRSCVPTIIIRMIQWLLADIGKYGRYQRHQTKNNGQDTDVNMFHFKMIDLGVISMDSPPRACNFSIKVPVVLYFVL